MIFAVSACTKTNGSKPTISIASIDTYVPENGTMTAIINFTDPSSNMSNGFFVAIRNRLNQIPLGPTAPNDTLSAPIPEFPNQQKGQIKFSLTWAQDLHESDAENDTIVFKFAAINQSGVSSDTILSPKIVVEK
jgi:hypothetical protein